MEKALGDKIETTYIENVPESADAERSIEQLVRTRHKLSAGYDVTGVQPWPDAIIDAPFAVCDENALRQIDARISEYLAWRAKKSMSRHADRLCSRSGAHRCGDQARPRGRHPLRAAALRRPLVRYFLRDRGTAIQ
jgi:hypothetical protein